MFVLFSGFRFRKGVIHHAPTISFVNCVDLTLHTIMPEALDLNLPYRHLIYGEYRTIFRIVEQTVYILRVIHGSRLLDLGVLE